MQMCAAPKALAYSRSGSAAGLANECRNNSLYNPTRACPRYQICLRFWIVSKSNKNHNMSLTEHVTMASNKTLLAYLALGVGIFSLSFSAMFVRWANAPGPVTAFYRLFFSIFLLLPFFVARAKKNQSIKTSSIIFPLLAGVFTACDLGLWTASLSYTTAANATLLGNTAPLWVALGTWLILKQRLASAFWRGLTIALFGAA